MPRAIKKGALKLVGTLGALAYFLLIRLASFAACRLTALLGLCWLLYAAYSFSLP